MNSLKGQGKSVKGRFFVFLSRKRKQKNHEKEKKKEGGGGTNSSSPSFHGLYLASPAICGSWR